MKDAPNVYPVKKQEFLSKMTALGIIGPDFFPSAQQYDGEIVLQLGADGFETH